MNQRASLSDPVWDNDIQDYFTVEDFDCMGPRGVHLDNYNWVRDHYRTIIGRIENKSMPPGGGWPDDKIARFKLWAKNGFQKP